MVHAYKCVLHILFWLQISLEGLAERQQATDAALSQLGDLHQAQQLELERQQAHQQQAEQSKDVHIGQSSKHSGSNSASKKPWHRTWPVASAAWMVGSLVATRFPACRPAQDLLLVYLLRKTCH